MLRLDWRTWRRWWGFGLFPTLTWSSGCAAMRRSIPPDDTTFYGGGTHGYTDYPTLVESNRTIVSA
jgi:hypothetical protein